MKTTARGDWKAAPPARGPGGASRGSGDAGVGEAGIWVREVLEAAVESKAGARGLLLLRPNFTYITPASRVTDGDHPPALTLGATSVR